MGGEQFGLESLLLGANRSLAWRADMVVYEECEAGDFGEGGYQRLEHIWEETWQAPRRVDRYGPGIGAGIMITARKDGGERQSPRRSDRRRALPDGGPACAGNGAGTTARGPPACRGAAGVRGRSLSTSAIGCDFSRLEAIWESWWSVPRCGGPPQRTEAKAVQEGASMYKAPVVGGMPALQSAKECGGEACARARDPGDAAPESPGTRRPSHRRSRSWTGTEFNRMAGPWPLWQAGVENIPGFDISELNGTCLTGSKD